MAALYGTQHDEFVTSLAALALYDGEAEISSDNIKTLLAATNNTVAPYWPALFAGILKDNKIEKLVFSAGEKVLGFYRWQNIRNILSILGL